MLERTMAFTLRRALATFPAVVVTGARQSGKTTMLREALETAVVVEWTKAFRHRGEPAPLSFWRTADGHEVDLVIERDGRLHAAEVKATATVVPPMASALRRFREVTGTDELGVLYADIPRAVALAPGVVARPWWSVGLP